MLETFHDMTHSYVSTTTSSAGVSAGASSTEFSPIALEEMISQYPDQNEDSFELLRKARAYQINDDYYSTSLNDRATALVLLHRALDLSRSSNDLTTEASCLQDICNIHDMNGDYCNAIIWAKFILAAFQKLSDQNGQMWAFQLLANLHYVISDYGNAIEFARNALHLSRHFNIPRNISNAYCILGCCYRDSGRNDEATIAFSQSLEALRSSTDTAQTLNSLVNALEHFCHVRRADKVRELCDEVTEILSDNPARPKIRAYVALATACYLFKGFDDTAYFCRGGIALCRETADQFSEAALLVTFGHACRSQGDYEAARVAFLQATEILESFGNCSDKAEAHLALAELYEAAGDITTSFGHFKLYHAIDKALFNEETERKIRAITIEMQLERARQEAEIHRVTSAELKELNAALENANSQLCDQNVALEAQAAMLQSYLTALEEQSELLQAQALELERLTVVDPLTGLYNRRYLDQWMTREFANSIRCREELAVALADVDHFKSINDTYGHVIGDEVLKVVAKILQDSCRIGDITARYGGEEFILAMPRTNVNDGRIACERIRESVLTYPWETVHSDLAVTISFGLSSDTSRSSYEHMISDADRYLYQAKEEGRNRVVCGANTTNWAS